MWITQCYLQLHQCLPLPCKHSPDGASMRLRISNCSLLLIYLPRKNERLSRPGWLSYSGQTVYPHKWSPISCKSSAKQGKFAGHRPTFYHCATHNGTVVEPVAPTNERDGCTGTLSNQSGRSNSSNTRSKKLKNCTEALRLSRVLCITVTLKKKKHSSGCLETVTPLMMMMIVTTKCQQ